MLARLQIIAVILKTCEQLKHFQTGMQSVLADVV